MFHIRHIEVLKISLNIYVMDEKYCERFNHKIDNENFEKNWINILYHWLFSDIKKTKYYGNKKKHSYYGGFFLIFC